MQKFNNISFIRASNMVFNIKPNDNYSLYNNVCVRLEVDYKEVSFRINKGFEFDGASIPRFLHSIIGVTPAHPDVLIAACIHDYLTRKTGEVWVSWDGIEKYRIYCFNRKQSDQIFKEVLRWSGMEIIKRNILYAGVRFGGWKAWNKYAKINNKKTGSSAK